MPRTTPIRFSPGETADDATLEQFVSVLIEIALADYAIEELFSDEVLNDCLQLVLAKNRGLSEFGGNPWPERRLAQATRSRLTAMRAAKRN